MVHDDPPSPSPTPAAEPRAPMIADEPLEPELPAGKKKKKKKEKGGPEGTARGIETMFRMVYQTHLELSTLADAKANIMISINGIIISVIIASIAPNMNRSPWLGLPIGVLLLACVASLVFSILAARPRVGSHVVPLEDLRSRRANILFFGNFVQMPEADFLDGIRGLMTRTDELYQTMARDIYSLGGVLSTKYRLLRVAYNIFMTGLVTGVVLLLAVLALDPGTPAGRFGP